MNQPVSGHPADLSSFTDNRRFITPLQLWSKFPGMCTTFRLVASGPMRSNRISQWRVPSLAAGGEGDGRVHAAVLVEYEITRRKKKSKSEMSSTGARMLIELPSNRPPILFCLFYWGEHSIFFPFREGKKHINIGQREKKFKMAPKIDDAHWPLHLMTWWASRRMS